MAGQNGLLFSKVPRHRSAVYLRIEQSSQLKQEFFIIFQCPLDGEQFTLDVGSVKSFKAVADYVHHCFDTRDELMNYILDALSKKSYRVQ